MKTCGVCKISLPEDQFSRNASKRDGLHTRCKACDRARNKARYAANREHHGKQMARWRRQNLKASAAHQAAYRKRHPGRDRLYREANRDRAREYQRAYHLSKLDENRAKRREWSKKNPGAHNALTARARACRRQATAAWADHDIIGEFYEGARWLTEQTGIPHEVDHIIPLVGKTVCGLHVHTNLRVVPMVVNRQKHARFEPDLINA